MELATFGGGCFWCLEAVFEQLAGVNSVTSGYAGGMIDHPTYEQVCSGTTGHAEVVQINFDPGVVTYDQLLEVFFAIHDPTTLNRQGADVGSQYRSVIFVHSSTQRSSAEALVALLTQDGTHAGPIVTELCDSAIFFPAEAYHQGYFRNNPGQGYCAYVVAPKAAAARRKFRRLLKPGYR